MQTYVEKLLQLQKQQADELIGQQGMELPQYSLQLKKLRQEEETFEENVSQPDLQQTAQKTGKEELSGQEDVQDAAALLEKLDLMQAANEGVQMQTQTEAAAIMQSLAAQQSVVLSRTQLLQEQVQAGSSTQMLFAGGIAARPTERSMQEISRFFERDARRYG